MENAIQESILSRVTASFENATGLTVEVQIKFLLTLFLLFALWWIRRSTLKVVLRHTTDVHSRYARRKVITNTAVLVGVLVIARIWFSGLEHFVTFLGLLSAGIAIALRDPLVNMVAWIFIAWRKPFVVGDRIQIGNHAGDIIDIRLFQITLLEMGGWVAADQLTGRIIHIPNAKVFTDTQANYTKAFPFIWNEIPVLVTFESDWQRAKTLLRDIIGKHTAEQGEAARASFQEAARHFLIAISDIEPKVYTSVQNSGVLLTIRYLCNPYQRRTSEQAVWEDILRTFAAAKDVDLAYPTTRYYDNVTEGKGRERPPKDSPEERKD
jgi:small-conductance mechanosensitive channel